MNMNKDPNNDEVLTTIIAILCVILALVGLYMVVDATTTGLIVRWPLPHNN